MTGTSIIPIEVGMQRMIKGLCRCYHCIGSDPPPARFECADGSGADLLPRLS